MFYKKEPKLVPIKPRTKIQLFYCNSVFLCTKKFFFRKMTDNSKKGCKIAHFFDWMKKNAICRQ